MKAGPYSELWIQTLANLPFDGLTVLNTHSAVLALSSYTVRGNTSAGDRCVTITKGGREAGPAPLIGRSFCE